MTDDDGREGVTGPPVLRLLEPPEASPPAAPAPDADAFPVLAPAPPAAPPESLSLPDIVIPGLIPESSDGTTMMNSAMDPAASPRRNAASATMVVAASIAVACLNGMTQVVDYLKTKAEHRKAAKGKAASDKGDTKTPRIPTGPEFGRSMTRNSSRQQGPGPRGSGGGGAFGSTGTPDRKRRQKGPDAPSRASNGSTGTKTPKRTREDRTGPHRAPRDRPDRRRSRGDRGGAGGDGAKGRTDRPDRPGKPSGGKGARRRKRSEDPKDRRTPPLSLRKERRKGSDPKKPKTEKSRTRKTDGDTPGAPKVDLTKKPRTKKGDEAKASSSKAAPKGGTKKSPKGPHSPGGRPGSRPWRKKGPKKERGKRKKPRREGRHARHDRPEENVRQDMPGADGEWLKPPPGWTVSYSVTVERDGPGRPNPMPEPAAVTTGRQGLPRAPENGAGPRPGTSRPTTPEAPPMEPTGEHRPMSTPVAVKTTQHTDSDLTIFDVIDSDADMAEEILAGADHARVVAEKCEEMTARLEALYAKVMDLKVPGVLPGLVLRLIEKAATVQAKAEAVAQTLPRASEAIAQAGSNAEARHRPLADAVKDAGHVAPAEREYHGE